MQAMYQAIDNRLADILSGSFGGPELAFSTSQEDADNQEFKQAASLGITLMFSSGDTADYLEPLGYDWPIAAVSWPASSPWVTAVGGTSLLLDKNGSKAEYGWGTYANTAYDDSWTGPFQIDAEAWMGWGFAGGGGGGTSMFMSQPNYQKGVVPASALRENQHVSGGNSLISWSAKSRASRYWDARRSFYWLPSGPDDA